MRELLAVVNECMEELDAIGIEYGNILEVKINTRAKNRWGQCKRIPRRDGYLININIKLLDERNDVNGLKNTIIHELLHSCEGCMNHGDNWKRLAEKVNRYYGYNIKRTSTADEKGVHEDFDINQSNTMSKYKYCVTCIDCGKKYMRTKMSNVVKFPDKYKCGICNGNLEVEFLF